MMMGLAYDFIQDRVCLDGMTRSMDYLLGGNPLNKICIFGYVENPLEHRHHRFRGNQPARATRPHLSVLSPADLAAAPLIRRLQRSG